MTERGYWLWFSEIAALSQEEKQKLVFNLASPREIYKLSEKQTKIKLKGIFPKKSEGRMEKIYEVLIYEKKNLKQINKKLEYMEENGISFTYCGENTFPSSLSLLKGTPLWLYYKGKLPDINLPCVAVVGARACSEYGRFIAKELGRELAVKGIQIISGMARGVDSYAHRGCIAGNGITFAVLASGVDVCYPRENYPMYEEIYQLGGIISENPLGTSPISCLFPMRNRIISGLSDLIIVVEAKEKSGSLITVEYGLMQGKDIMAVPGRVTEPLSKGCNRLIREGAGVVTCVSDVLDMLSMKTKYNRSFQKKINYTLDRELDVVYSDLGLFPKSIQSLCEDLDLEITDLSKRLLQLQVMNLVEEKTKGYYIAKQ